MKLWLDDERPAPEGWVWVKTVEEAELAFLGTDDSANPTMHEITELSVDHDLGEDARPGYDLLVWLEEAVHDGMWDPPLVTVHSMNAGARPKMVAAAANINRMRDP
jgi:hypothetical protein